MRTITNRFARVQTPPYFGDEWQVAEAVDKSCAKITAEFRRRKLAGKPEEPDDQLRPSTWLKPVCYEFILSFIKDEVFEILEHRIERYGRRRRGEKGKPGIFQTGLLAIFAHDADGLSHQTREKFGKQLWYAFRHYVPPPLLNGFIYQCTTSRIEDLARTSHVERDFEHWVVERLSEDQMLIEIRGRYEPNIMRQVNDLIEQRERNEAEEDWSDETDEESDPMQGDDGEGWD